MEWLGRSDDAAELAQIIGEMPATLGDMEIAFLIAIGRAALAGHKAAPQSEAEAKARPATLTPPPEAPAVWTDVDAFRRRQREHQRAATVSDQQRKRFRRMQNAFPPRWGEGWW